MSNHWLKDEEIVVDYGDGTKKKYQKEDIFLWAMSDAIDEWLNDDVHFDRICSIKNVLKSGMEEGERRWSGLKRVNVKGI